MDEKKSLGKPLGGADSTSEGTPSDTAPQGRTAEKAVFLETADHQMVIPDFEVESIARCLLPKMQAYFNSAEGKEKFEAWRQNRPT